MLVAFGIGTVYYSITISTTNKARTDHFWIYFINLSYNAVIEDITLSVKIFSSFFYAIFYDPAMELINIFKS
jgi:hypothetical protein